MMMPSQFASPKRAASTWLWIGLICIASLALSRAFACAMPFAALATLAAFTLHRRESAALLLFTWITNQAVGFGLMHYPWTVSTVAWGFAIGVAAIAALIAAGQVARYGKRRLLVSPIGLVVAFGTYELVLFATALLMSSATSAFTVTIVFRIFAINALAFGLLVSMEQLAGVVMPSALRARNG